MSEFNGLEWLFSEDPEIQNMTLSTGQTEQVLSECKERIAEVEAAYHALFESHMKMAIALAEAHKLIRNTTLNETHRQRITELEHERDRFKDAWERGNVLIEAMEEVKNSQLARIADLEQAVADQKEYIEDSAEIEMQLRAENAELKRKVEQLTKPKKIHSCDTPGCVSCGNPDESDIGFEFGDDPMGDW